MIKFLPILLLVGLLVSCSDDKSNDEDSSSNNFTASGQAISIDDITTTSTSSLTASNTGYEALSTEAYYGRFLYYDSSNLYGGIVKFNINKENNSTAFFSDFSLLYFARVDSFTSSTPLVTSEFDLNVNSAYSSSNSISIENSTSRFVDFSVDFGDNTYFPDIDDASVIFSSDFSTLVGGNDSTFFLIAQKASSAGNLSLSDITASWSFAHFTVSGLGNIEIQSTSSVTASGTGGNGYTAFKGTNSEDGFFDGELSLIDSTAGIFIFGLGYGSGTPTARQTTGLFLVSPDKRFVLGANFRNGIYFVGNK